MRFASIQIKLAILEIIRNFEITTNSDTPNPYIMNSKSFIAPGIRELWFDLKKL